MTHANHPLLRLLGACMLLGLMLVQGAQAQAQAQTQTPAPAEAPNGADSGAGGAAALRAKYQALQPQLASNPFKRRITLESTENPSKLSGDIYAVVDHPF